MLKEQPVRQVGGALGKAEVSEQRRHPELVIGLSPGQLLQWSLELGEQLDPSVLPDQDLDLQQPCTRFTRERRSIRLMPPF